MNYEFLTPVSLWKDFDYGQPLQQSKINEMRYDNVVYSEYYFSGRKTASGRVRIYGLFVCPDDGKKHSALLYIPEITEKMSYESINEYAKLGYSVLAVDLYGRRSEGAENYTGYPDDIAYANYESRGRHMDHVDTNAKETSWYEWVSVCKYALKFLRTAVDVDKIGVIGVKDGANIAWQLAATEGGIACAVMMFGAGWSAYRGIPKYSDKDIVMDEERRRFIAAVDPHAYAQYVRCPILYLTATNSEIYDFDRSNDTLARINPDIEYEFNYAPAFNLYLDNYCKKDVEMFLARYFGQVGVDFPRSPELALEQEDNYLRMKLTFDEPGKVSECKVFLNEGSLEPSLRNWISCDRVHIEDEDPGSRTFEYIVNGNPQNIFAFAVVRYRNGCSLSSKLIGKKFSGTNRKRANLVYTSKDGLDGITFYDKNAYGKKDVFVDVKDFIQLVKGADDIYGAYSRFGLISYKFNEPNCYVDENSIIKLDIFTAEFCVLRLVLMTKGETPGEFVWTEDFGAGNIWRNVTVHVSDFKSAEGMSVRNYDEIYALRIESDSKFAVNNILLI